MPGTLHCPYCGTNKNYSTASPPAEVMCPECLEIYKAIDGLGAKEEAPLARIIHD